MAGFNPGGDDDVISHINVVPLVDIVLVLLIIFMLTTSYIVRQQIKVDLPRAASGEAEVSSTIGARVASRTDDEPDLRAIIAADKAVEYGRVVDLIDTIKQNGLDKFALNIERKDKAVP